MPSNREYDIWLSKPKSHGKKWLMLFKNTITTWPKADLDLLWLLRRCRLDIKGTWCCLFWVMSRFCDFSHLSRSAVPTCYRSTLNCSVTTVPLLPEYALWSCLHPTPALRALDIKSYWWMSSFWLVWNPLEHYVFESSMLMCLSSRAEGEEDAGRRGRNSNGNNSWKGEKGSEERHQDPAGGKEPEAELGMENAVQVGMGGRHVLDLFLKLYLAVDFLLVWELT